MVARPVPHAEPTAYGREPGRHDPLLTEIGAGTPMGELLRRYWHPVGLSADAGAVPRKVLALGEELILFRDGKGRPGLVVPRCAHRGASLFYGRTEERGIRCCYHGWLFDVEGRCLEQPCEPDGGRARAHVRQPWYPVEERYGLIFAYMGPPERRPVLPRHEALEALEPGESVEADGSSIGGGGPPVIPCNWFQHFENVVDPFHVPVLHGSFSGVQFTDLMGKMPEVEFGRSAFGVKVTSIRRLESGETFRRITEAVLPTLRVVPNPRVGSFQRVESIGWVLPMDETHFRIYVAGRVRAPGDLARMRSRLGEKLWEELAPEEHQRYPGDYEAQVSQGAVTLHTEEHLAASDRGIAMLRKLFKEQIAAVAAGGDPLGVSFDPDAPPVRFEAGNFAPGNRAPVK